MKGKLIWSIFWVLVGVFVIAVSTMFIPPLGRLPVRFNGLAAWVVIAGLGVTLLVLTVKTKVGGMLKKFLLLTGASAAGLPVFVLLHGLVSGLFNTEEPVFFITAIMVCPIGFLVGAVGSIVLAIKTKPSVPAEIS
jgi:divalent metal cation (Fe/Co/Zn/Cd) transporter